MHLHFRFKVKLLNFETINSNHLFVRCYFILLFLLLSHLLHSQVFTARPGFDRVLITSEGKFYRTIPDNHIFIPLLSSYNQCIVMGDTLDGKRSGLWRYYSGDGILYIEGHYENNVAVGEWQLNYPNGLLRRTMTFDSTSMVTNWSRFDQGCKVIEVSNSRYLSYTLVRILNTLDQSIFDCEQNQFTTDIHISRRDTITGISQHYYDAEVERQLNNLVRMMTGSTFTARVSYWKQNGTQRSEYDFHKGKLINMRVYKYLGKYLIKGRIYFEKDKKRIDYYKPNGKTWRTKTRETKHLLIWNETNH